MKVDRRQLWVGRYDLCDLQVRCIDVVRQVIRVQELQMYPKLR